MKKKALETDHLSVYRCFIWQLGGRASSLGTLERHVKEGCRTGASLSIRAS
jgi:hypothetical protein